MVIKGIWTPRWQPVVDTFSENFVAMGETGASLALYHQGECVVHLWAGEYSNQLAGVERADWCESTLVNVFSAGKGLVALCILQLVAEGRLDVQRPVAYYWPEFAVGAKANIRVVDVLCHRSGLSAFHPLLKDEQIFDWAFICNAIADETPWWEPGTAQGYSPFMYGWILGELVRRISGYETFDAYFQARVAQPLQASCYFGVPDHLLASIADTGPLKRPLATAAASSEGANSVALGKLMKSDPRGVTNRAFGNPISLMVASNTAAWRQAQIPAANAHATAHALASLYGSLAHNDGRLLPSDLLPLCWQEQSFAQDKVLGIPLRFSQGFMLSQADRADCRYGRGLHAFGHPGAGGCVGFADRDYGIGFGYTTHRMGQSLLIDERAVRLIDSLYAVLAA